MDLDFKGRTIVVTGGGRGICRVMCATFAREGANVVAADILPDDARVGDDGTTTEQECMSHGVRASYIHTDVTQLDSVMKMRDEVMETYGQIDVLVNGAAWWENGYFWESNPASWAKEMNVIMLGSMNCCKAIAEPMMKAKSGAIVNIASDAGRGGESRQVTYGASKAGIIGLTRGLALELGYHKIRVNCVAPGRTQTPRGIADREAALAVGEKEAEAYLEREKRALRVYALRKFGKMQDVANMVVFLSSPSGAGHVTGQTISVSGGYTMV
ncbi:MAG: SDR family oxidoreductase [Dehalococcoidia bacterium]|nr:SDR family oxidoreductase [Dehalococcoidia bacterium]MDP6228138.1 SDR family oxidoreductase [Dehalococcoidia bacterium]MDP7082912.1 SDR family oxidoreductase [Dehalococcoidia bacterium]MDP7511685.1 SDR family oxidoreductase [Dehalococcoidia bacterium]HJN86690.1 SDR family oxidoreductase [Dehalococcoidia bacterium]